MHHYEQLDRTPNGTGLLCGSSFLFSFVQLFLESGQFVGIEIYMAIVRNVFYFSHEIWHDGHIKYGVTRSPICDESDVTARSSTTQQQQHACASSTAGTFGTNFRTTNLFFPGAARSNSAYWVVSCVCVNPPV